MSYHVVLLIIFHFYLLGSVNNIHKVYDIYAPLGKIRGADR
jgi:hypothetical protein